MNTQNPFSAPQERNQIRKSKIYTMAMTGVMTAVICILAPMSISIGPVPISLTNLAIFLSLYLLGWKMGALSCVVYLLIGMVGMPVFSGFSGGLGKLLGPTGGYIIGFLPMAVISGMVIDRCKSPILHFLAMVAGTGVLYAFGTAWFCVVMDSAAPAALSACVFPFIPIDMGKILAAAVVGPLLRGCLNRAGLRPAF